MASEVIVSFSKSSDRGSRHQKQPAPRQHFRNRFPLPHGHKSLRPSFSSSSLSPCTMRRPRLTCVSDGKPLRRLLMVSKAGLVVVVELVCITESAHGTPPALVNKRLATLSSGTSLIQPQDPVPRTSRLTTQASSLPQRPRQESNLALDLRRVACNIRHTPRTE